MVGISDLVSYVLDKKALEHLNKESKKAKTEIEIEKLKLETKLIKARKEHLKAKKVENLNIEKRFTGN